MQQEQTAKLTRVTTHLSNNKKPTHVYICSIYNTFRFFGDITNCLNYIKDEQVKISSDIDITNHTEFDNSITCDIKFFLDNENKVYILKQKMQ